MYLESAKGAKLKVDQEKHKIEQKNALSVDAENDIRVLEKQDRDSRAELERLRQEEEVVDWDLADGLSALKQKKEKLEENYRRILSSNEPIIADMKERMEGFREELKKLSDEIEKEAEEIDQKTQRYSASVKAAQVFEKERHKKREDLHLVQQKPDLIKKNIQIMMQVKADLEEDAKRLETELAQYDSELEMLEAQKKRVKEQYGVHNVLTNLAKLNIAKRRNETLECTREQEQAREQKERAREKVTQSNGNA